MHKRLSIILKDQHKQSFKTLNKDEQLDLEKHGKVLKIQRISFTQELLANLKKVDTDVHELKEAISLDIQNVGLHYFKDVVKAINDCLDRNDNSLNFKHKDLFEKEKLLSDELRLIELEVLDVNSGRSNRTKILNNKPLETYHINLPESICLFDEFLLKSGGHSGGWKPEDHQLFLHLRNKFPPEQGAEILHHKLPDISIDQVLEHNRWYEKYNSLLHDKKQALEKWKSTKKSGRSQSVGNIEDIIRADTPSSNPRNGRKTSRKSDEVKKQIAAWKFTKSEILKEEQELKRREKEKKLAKEKEIKEIKMLEKQKVTDYISSKLRAQLQQMEEHKTLRQEEQKNKARKANIMVQVFRKQDEKKLQEKLERKRQVALAQLETQERLRRVKCEVKVSRDPHRVLQPTTEWKNKVAKEAEEKIESARDVAFITHVPHLKVPDWRQDVKFQDQIIL